ncbi:MAG: hypothetical protein LBV58_01170 [Acholeplasmatales bacterium]|jgi:hypothetical protein|nr:hypothetical protein [Acholeplasmatales bacterium]
MINKTKRLLKETMFFTKSIDLKFDNSILYGLNKLKERKDSYLKQGYEVSVSFNVLYKDHLEYIDGEFNKIKHLDDVELLKIKKSKSEIEKKINFFVPTLDFIDYLKSKLEEVIGLGFTEIYLEDIFFYKNATNSIGFQKEYFEYYQKEYLNDEDREKNIYPFCVYLLKRLILDLSSHLKMYATKKFNRTIFIYLSINSIYYNLENNVISPLSSLDEFKDIDGYVIKDANSSNTSKYSFLNPLLDYLFLSELIKNSQKRIIISNTFSLSNKITSFDEVTNKYLRLMISSLIVEDAYGIDPFPYLTKIYSQKYDSDTLKNEIESLKFDIFTNNILNTYASVIDSNSKNNFPPKAAILLNEENFFKVDTAKEIYTLLQDQYINPILEQGLLPNIIFAQNIVQNLETYKLIVINKDTFLNLDEIALEKVLSFTKNRGLLIILKSDLEANDDKILDLLNIKESLPTETLTEYDNGYFLITKEINKSNVDIKDILSKKKYEVRDEFFGDYLIFSRGSYRIIINFDKNLNTPELEGTYALMNNESFQVQNNPSFKSHTFNLVNSLDKLPEFSIIGSTYNIFSVNVLSSKSCEYIINGKPNIEGVIRIKIREVSNVVFNNEIIPYSEDNFSTILIKLTLLENRKYRLVTNKI